MSTPERVEILTLRRALRLAFESESAVLKSRYVILSKLRAERFKRAQEAHEYEEKIASLEREVTHAWETAVKSAQDYKEADNGRILAGSKLAELQKENESLRRQLFARPVRPLSAGVATPYEPNGFPCKPDASIFPGVSEAAPSVDSSNPRDVSWALKPNAPADVPAGGGPL